MRKLNLAEFSKEFLGKELTPFHIELIEVLEANPNIKLTLATYSRTKEKMIIAKIMQEIHNRYKEEIEEK